MVAIVPVSNSAVTTLSPGNLIRIVTIRDLSTALQLWSEFDPFRVKMPNDDQVFIGVPMDLVTELVGLQLVDVERIERRLMPSEGLISIKHMLLNLTCRNSKHIVMPES